MCLIFLAPNSWGFWPLIRHMGQRRAGLPGTCPAQQLGSLSRKDTDIHPGLPVLPTFLSSSFGQQSTMVQKRWALCPLILSDQNFPRILASFCPHHPQNSLSCAVSWRGIKKMQLLFSKYYPHYKHCAVLTPCDSKCCRTCRVEEDSPVAHSDLESWGALSQRTDSAAWELHMEELEPSTHCKL